ncbi:hypothetical protein ACPCG0_04200 [Propionibacteriaceae bacterium Y1923]
MQTPEAFVVGYSPVRAAGRVAKAESMRRRAWLSTAIYAVIVGVLWYWLRYTASTWQILLGFIPTALIVIAFLVWRYVELHSARKSLGTVPAGEALRIDHTGIHVDATGSAQTFEWSGLQEISVTGRRLGAGPDLGLTSTNGSWKVPVSFLDTLPGTIDSAIRAYSGGRRSLDLSGMDSIWGE